MLKVYDFCCPKGHIFEKFVSSSAAVSRCDCGEDAKKWEEVLETAKEALKFRLKLWDHITEAILKLNTLELQNT